MNNVAKLTIKRLSVLAVPRGGGIADGIKFFRDEEHRKKLVLEAEAWTKEAIKVFKTAVDNPFGDDDEAIAGYILDKIQGRSKK